ncbi:MAG: T9SS type A sorting domain-containing protein [bacterium]|nr:T9SS type A sorting domain-containing protein [bacterium]
MRRLLIFLPLTRLGAVILATGLLTGVALADPHIYIEPTQTEAGGVVFLHIRDFEPGDYDVSIRFDDVEIATWYLPLGGDGDTFLPVPGGAALGGHDITVCAACDQGDLEQSATTRLTITSGELTGDEYNMQLQAIEVTQGVRGDIPGRTPPGGSFVLSPETAVHVANRRTVVRVYPWMEVGETALLRHTIFADLSVSRGGVPLGTLNSRCAIAADKTLAEMRGDPRFSFEFALPEDWVELVPAGSSFSLDLTATITTPLGETNPADDTLSLSGVDFQHVGNNNSFAFRFRPFLVQLTYANPAGGDSLTQNADVADVVTALRNIQEVLPIADGHRGLRLFPWRFVNWSGPTEIDDEEVFDIAMIRRFFPNGRLHGNPDNDYYGYLFKAGLCAGHAYLNSPYFKVGVCPRPLYVTAHEITHAISQPHAGNGHNEADGGGFDAAYPPPGTSHGQVEPNTFGYDIYNGLAMPPWTGTVAEFARHDYMSYGPDTWVSRYTWDNVAESLGSPAVQPTVIGSVPVARMTMALRGDDDIDKNTVDRLMFMTGTVDWANNLLSMHPLFAAPSGQQQPGTSGSMHFVFYDLNSNFLGEHWSDPVVRQDDFDGLSILVDAVLFPAGWESMEIGDGQNVWQTVNRSLNLPAVQIDNMTDGFNWPNTGLVDIEWTGSDADLDPLIYRLIGVRETTEMHVLASDLTVSEFTLELATVPGGGDWEIFVEASDGLNSAFSTSYSGWIEPQPPQPLITYPREGSTYLADVPLQAQGYFADYQSDDPQVPMDWTLDGAPAGSGPVLTMSQLGTGPHSLTLNAVNAFQQQSSFTVDFTVIDELLPPDPIAPPDNEPGEPLPPLLTWTTVAGAGGYRVQIALDPEFKLPVVDEGNLVEPSFEFSLAYPTVQYYWRTLAETGDVASGWSVVQNFTTGGVSAVAELPGARSLDLTVHPNPFNASTSLSFDLPHGGPAELVLYDLGGRRIRTLVSETLSAGPYAVNWNGHDDRGLPVASGVYLVRLRALGLEETQRMVLLK